MEQTVGLRGLSKLLYTCGERHVARNSWVAELNQAATHLAYRVLAGIPRPIEVGQRNHQGPGCEEFEQYMSETQEQGPATHALARASLIVSQSQLFNFVEVDFNLEATRVGMDGLHGVQGEIRANTTGREQARGQ
jgi:hypothetical protein